MILDFSAFTCSEHDPASNPTNSPCLNFPGIVYHATSQAGQPLRRKNHQTFLCIDNVLIFDKGFPFRGLDPDPFELSLGSELQFDGFSGGKSNGPLLRKDKTGITHLRSKQSNETIGVCRQPSLVPDFTISIFSLESEFAVHEILNR